MKKVVLLISTIVLSATVFASGIKVGLTTDPPTYKQYSKGMNLGVSVGDQPTYKHYSESTQVGVQVGNPEVYQAQLPFVFRKHEELSPIDKEAFKFGVMLGFLISSYSGDRTDDFKYAGNLLLGIYAMVAITAQFTVMPQLYYAALGTKFDGFDNRLATGYLMLPVLLYYTITSQFMVGLGPYLGLLLRARDKGPNSNEDVKDFVKGVDAGLKLAVMYQVSSYLTFSLSFSRGFVNIQDSDNFKQFNQAFMATAFVNLTHLLNR